MPIISKRDPNRFYDLTLDRFEKSGVSTRAAKNNIARNLAEIQRDILSLVYTDLYNVTDNILPSDARGQALDRYNEMLGEDRIIISPPKDLSFDNVYLELPGGAVASDLTIDAGSIQLRSGFELSDDDFSTRVRVINSPVFAPDSNRAYCQVIYSGTSNIQNISANTLTRASIDLGSVSNINITSLVISTLSVVQPKAIGTTRVGLLSDREVPFVLSKK